MMRTTGPARPHLMGELVFDDPLRRLLADDSRARVAHRGNPARDPAGPARVRACPALRDDRQARVITAVMLGANPQEVTSRRLHPAEPAERT
jgi:hypothetical protein